MIYHYTAFNLHQNVYLLKKIPMMAIRMLLLMKFLQLRRLLWLPNRKIQERTK
ncbi:hypothetical protein GDO86_020183 [Hymenochirus boettgeri]|uniref:Uncharacterized protein n=1 Tax=Hymenochirus boettgeri TaxID=247094 RepID=A0A8T2IG69_9PIPI|nr:hypothetical protein GDO86_020183 [Hymenochirus boettgeri]